MNCLSQSELESTLGDVAIPIPPAWEKHIESCPECQSRLERAAGSGNAWDSACRNLKESSFELDLIGAATEEPRKPGLYDSTIFYRVDVDTDEVELANVKYSRDQKIEVDLDAPSHPENLGRIGRYELERTVGRGGMGIVFKGFDAELNRPVAVKILSPHLAGHGTARQRFTREAKAAAAVVHDNVVPIYDIQSNQKQPFLVMPFVNGLSLEDYVEKQGQIDTGNLLQVALQIASGLAAAHAQGLIHRDIKPANILLENGLNRVQITDFGLARAVDDAAMTHSGMIAGTPHYMSPEQAQGAPLDPRSDLFSLGCVMYFMATGRTLHRGDGPFSIIAQICRGKYTPVREINPDIPKFVAETIDKLLEPKPQDRFQSAAQLAQHLEVSLAYHQHPTSQKAPKRIWNSRQVKKLRQGISLSVAGLILLTLVGLFATGQIGSASNWWSGGSSSPSQSPLAPEVSMPSLNDFKDELDEIDEKLGKLEWQLQQTVSDPYATSDHLEYQLMELEQLLAPSLESEMSGRPSQPQVPYSNQNNQYSPGRNSFQQRGPSSRPTQNQSTNQNGLIPDPKPSKPKLELEE